MRLTVTENDTDPYYARIILALFLFLFPPPLNNSVFAIVNTNIFIIEGEQCYFPCENGEYRMIISDNL
jgi:hypothetical protein